MQNVAFSLSGNAVVLGIGFLLTPVIARIYGPAAYGQFAIFTAVASIIGPISTFQLQAGYVAAKDEEQFAALIKISLFLLISVTTITLLGVIIYTSSFNSKGISSSLAYTLPIYIFFGGLFSIFRGWNIRLEEFKRAAQSKVFATLIGKFSTIGFGWFVVRSAMGMVVGSLATFVLESSGYATKKLRSSMSQVFHSSLTRTTLRQTIADFTGYPKYVTTNSIITNFGSQVPIYFIALWFSTQQVGLFSLSLSLITIPINLIGTSIGAVFLPKITSLLKEPARRNLALVSLYKNLFYPGLLGLVFLAVLLKVLLPMILGEGWEGAGQLSAFIALSFTFTIVATPISVTYRLIHFEKVNLSLTLISILLKIGGLSLGLIWGDFIYSIAGYFAVSILHNASQVYFLFRKLGINTANIYRDILVSFGVFVLAYYLTQLI